MGEKIIANFSIQPRPKMVAEFTIKDSGGGTKDHDKLENRDIPDQHPIGAITDLEDRLSAIEDNSVPITREINNKSLEDDITLYGTDIKVSNNNNATIKDELDNKVNKNSSITGATKTKITYDSKGLVTNGEDLSASDIPDLSATYIRTNQKGNANGVASLDNNGVVPTTQLPSATSSSKGAVIVDSELSSTSENAVQNKKIKEAIDTKQNTITGGATTIVSVNLATDKALVSNGSGKVATSSVTSTELGYVSGATSNIQNQIDNLKSRGRFLSLWNCVTGLAQSTPASLPYEYKTGDYFIVGTVGATNYKPNGSQYTGVASTTVETSTVAVNDTFYYDGTNWILQVNSERDVSFSSIVGQPSDNANLKTALDNKYDISNPNGYISKSDISADSPIAYNNSTGKISVASGYQIPTTAQVTQIGTNTTNIALKANIASPEFTGTPKAPTPATSTNNTQIATTEFVKSAISADTCIVRTSGNQTISGTKTFSSAISGDITGTSARATADGNGNNIVNTYATKSELENIEYVLQIIEW